jgi:hypothetical protein
MNPLENCWWALRDALSRAADKIEWFLRGITGACRECGRRRGSHKLDCGAGR